MALHIRPFAAGDEAALRAVFYSSIHQLARADYRQEQLDAWAPAQYDAAAWAERIQSIQPFIAQVDGTVAGYADLQPDGLIDHFFVAGTAAGKGVGRALMQHLLALATAQGMRDLTSHVSVTAQPFFAHFGFSVVEQRLPVIRGVALANALMRKRLGTDIKM